MSQPTSKPATAKRQRSQAAQIDALVPKMTSVDDEAYRRNLPCLNPNCKSHGAPHPNCRCYGMAEGGEAGHYCSTARPHAPGCEYYADGGESMGEGASMQPEASQGPLIGDKEVELGIHNGLLNGDSISKSLLGQGSPNEVVGAALAHLGASGLTGKSVFGSEEPKGLRALQHVKTAGILQKILNKPMSHKDIGKELAKAMGYGDSKTNRYVEPALLRAQCFNKVTNPVSGSTSTYEACTPLVK